MMKKNVILNGECLEILKTLPDESVDCCITSPPYYGLRDYGTGKWIGGDPNCPHYRTSHYSPNTATGHKAMYENAGAMGAVSDGIYKKVCPKCGAVREDKQVGLEETPQEYIDRLVAIFREVRRVLKSDGTLWVNIGDSYNSTGHSRNEDGSITFSEKAQKQSTNVGSYEGQYDKKIVDCCKPKDLIGIPWMLAFALRNDGWWLRQDIIWEKPNAMPESIKDRCTKSHEYIFLFAKSQHYYFDYKSIQEIAVSGDGLRMKRDVWSVIPAHYNLAHFATFPTELIEPMVLAGCPKDGIVLDPFMGSGTTAVVAKANHRNYLGIELNTDYVKMAEHRIKTTRRKLI